jgi:asparagine synthase (glutamine-hydrolysing)
MCGVCGWLSLDGSPIDRPVVEEMTAMLRHRGPDGYGYHFEDRVAFGHRRLAIIDPDAGQQPLANDDDSVWITYNGEIYNFPELMAELRQRGHRFRTRCDTEVIVRAYEEWGIDCLSRLNGMFAFALWDRRTRRLLLARDPYGLKPLYYWRDASHLLFSSEVKGLLADPTFPREIDRAALDEYLTYLFVPSPRTMFKGVQKLRPGHYLSIEDGQVKHGSFAPRAPRVRDVRRQPASIVELQDHLTAAIQRQMIADVPVGALLSGGVDSATVVALMRRVSGQRVMTFTVGFAGDFPRNELVEARRTASALGTEHHEIVISKRDYLDSFERLVWHLDEPIGTWAALPMYWVSALAARHVKVVLTGQGADEPWGGYRRHRGERLGEWYRLVPPAVRSGVVAPLVNRLPRALSLKRGVYALGTDDLVQRMTEAYTVFTPDMKQRLYRAGFGEHGSDALRYWQAPVRHLDSLAQHLYIETRFSLADNLLMYGDKLAMAHALEARHPLLDIELMQFAEGLPSDLRLRGWSGHKYLYRKAIARWLPEEILHRPKKGFETPFDEWFQEEIGGQVRDELTSSTSSCTRYFHPSYIHELIDKHVSRREDHTRMLLTLLIFEHWHRSFAGKAAGPPVPRAATAARIG